MTQFETTRYQAKIFNNITSENFLLFSINKEGECITEKCTLIPSHLSSTSGSLCPGKTR